MFSTCLSPATMRLAPVSFSYCLHFTLAGCIYPIIYLLRPTPLSPVFLLLLFICLLRFLSSLLNSFSVPHDTIKQNPLGDWYNRGEDDNISIGDLHLPMSETCRQVVTLECLIPAGYKDQDSYLYIGHIMNPDGDCWTFEKHCPRAPDAMSRIWYKSTDRTMKLFLLSAGSHFAWSI